MYHVPAAMFFSSFNGCTTSGTDSAALPGSGMTYPFNAPTSWPRCSATRQFAKCVKWLYILRMTFRPISNVDWPGAAICPHRWEVRRRVAMSAKRTRWAQSSLVADRKAMDERASCEGIFSPCLDISDNKKPADREVGRLRKIP